MWHVVAGRDATDIYRKMIKKIPWKDEYCVGHPEIDDQHRRLIGAMNIVIENINAPASSEAITTALDDLATFNRKHLAYEEKLLEELGYPDLDRVKREHGEFLEESGEILFSATVGEGDIAERVARIISTYWHEHIVDEIAECRRFFRQVH